MNWVNFWSSFLGSSLGIGVLAWGLHAGDRIYERWSWNRQKKKKGLK